MTVGQSETCPERRCECENPDRGLFIWRDDPNWWSCVQCDGRVRPLSEAEQQQFGDLPVGATTMTDHLSQLEASRNEVFHDGLTTYWLIADDRRAANDAVAEAAKAAGPFEDYINVQLVTGRIERGDEVSAAGWRFVVDPDGDVECWEVDAQ